MLKIYVSQYVDKLQIIVIGLLTFIYIGKDIVVYSLQQQKRVKRWSEFVVP